MDIFRLLLLGLVGVTGSNLVSIPLDTVLFNLLAFGGVMSAAILWAIIIGEIVVKFLVGAVVALWRS